MATLERISALLIVGSLGLAGVSAQAQYPGYECMSEGSENVLCAWLPSDAEAVREKRAAEAAAKPSKTVAKTGNGKPALRRVTMLTPDVLAGGDLGLENEFEAQAIAGGASSLVSSGLTRGNLEALRAATRVQNQIRAIEVFFKSGPAAGGDLMTVISAGKKDAQ